MHNILHSPSYLICYVFILSSDYRQVEVDDHTFSYTGSPQDLIWGRFGLKMHLPDNALPHDLKECQIRVKVSPPGQFQFPEGTDLVSGLYLIDCSSEFKKPVKVEIQHCAAIKPDDLQDKLIFVVADRTQEAPFTVVNGGVFSPSDRYGVIQMNHFSIVGIAQKHPVQLGLKVYQPQSPRRYLARLYYSIRGIHSWKAHFTIMWNLDISIAVSIVHSS